MKTTLKSGLALSSNSHFSGSFSPSDSTVVLTHLFYTSNCSNNCQKFSFSVCSLFQKVSRSTFRPQLQPKSNYEQENRHHRSWCIWTSLHQGSPRKWFHSNLFREDQLHRRPLEVPRWRRGRSRLGDEVHHHQFIQGNECFLWLSSAQRATKLLSQFTAGE